MDKETQISAFISNATRDLLEKTARAKGLKKSYLIEEALRHHLLALQELPPEAIIHRRIVLTRQSGEELLKRLRSPKRPSKALRRLMADDGD